MKAALFSEEEMDNPSCHEVLDHLNEFINSRVESPFYRKSLLSLVEGSRSEQTVTIREIYETYMQYVKANISVDTAISGEKEMWSDLLHHWQHRTFNR